MSPLAETMAEASAVVTTTTTTTTTTTDQTSSSSAAASASMLDEKTTASTASTATPADKLRSHILRIRHERNISTQRQYQRIETMRCALFQLTKDVTKRQRDFLRDNSVRTYAPYMRSSEMPTYLLVLQSKVLKHLHQLCVLTAQRRLVEAHSKAAVGAIKKQMMVLGDEQTALELQLLNCMVQIQSDEQCMQKSYESLLSQQTEELEVLQEAVDDDDELDQLIDQIANESVMALKYKQEALLQKQQSSSSSSSLHMESLNNNKSKSGSFSSFRLRTPTRKKKTKSLSLQEMLSTGEKEQKTMHASITETDDDESMSMKSFSLKMSQSLGFMFDNHNKRSTNPREVC